MKRVLIANRGEIAVRIMRTLKKMKIESVAVYSDTDKGAMFVKSADYAVALDGFTSEETYLDQDNPDRILLWEKWETREHYEAYLAWRMETGMMEMIGPFLDGAPEFTHLGAQD